MCEVSKFRVRNYLKGKKIAEAHQKERRQLMAGFHVRRTEAEIKIIEGFASSTHPLQARVVLNDFTPTHLWLFTTRPLMPGQMVAVTLSHPRRFYVRGRIIQSQECEVTTRVFTEIKFNYRVRVEFIFSSLIEQASVKTYADELARTLGTRPFVSGLTEEELDSLINSDEGESV